MSNNNNDPKPRPLSPEFRKQIVHEAFKRAGKIEKDLTDEEKAFAFLKQVTTDVSAWTLNFVKQLGDAKRYDAAGTHGLMLLMYREKLKTLDKDQLLYLLCMLQSSVQVEWITEQVNMGLIGPDRDKPI